jgi:hypothetical protein
MNGMKIFRERWASIENSKGWLTSEPSVDSLEEIRPEKGAQEPLWP